VNKGRYWWRVTARRSWRQALLLAVLGGLLGAVALGAVAGARRTSTAYDRYLTSIRASDVFVNVPGRLPAEPVRRPIRLISQLPGIVSSAAYIGLVARPVIHGRVDRSATAPMLDGSLDGEYFRQDRMTVLAGQLPAQSSATEIVLTPRVARLFGTGVGGRVSYAFQRYGLRGLTGPVVRKAYRVAAIVELPPVLVDSTDQAEFAVLPPGATRQALPYYGYAWVAVRLAGGSAGIPALQHELARLASSMAQRERRVTGNQAVGLSFNIQRYDTVRAQVRESIRPQVTALAIFGGIAALAMLVLVGQGLTQLTSRSAPDTAVLRMLGATRAQAAVAAGLPGLLALAGGGALAVAGAVALSPLAPVGPVRNFDPVQGVQADGLVLGGGVAIAAVVLLGLLAVLTVRSVRQRPAGAAAGHPSAIAIAAARAGLPAAAVIGSRNALEPGAGARAAPVRSAIAGSIAAVTSVTAAVVFGTSLAGLVSHPARYGWNWDIAIQAQGGYSAFIPGRLNQLISDQHAVAGWSELAFTQLPIDRRVFPVMGIRRHLAPVQPLTISGRPLSAGDQIEFGETTLRDLGKKIGDTVRLGTGPDARTLTITGTVALPSFGLSTGDHVSLGRGAMLPEDTLLAVEGLKGRLTRAKVQALDLPSAVAIDLVPGATPAQRARLIHRIVSHSPDGQPGGTSAVPTAIASSVSNAAQMGNQPLALAIGLAAAAVLSLALTVLSSVRRRRQELALLKALGMTRGQVWGVIAWQTTLTLLIAIVVGLPLGIAAGRWAWHAFAGSIGAVPVTEIPLLALILGLAALAVAGNLLTAVPAAIAARTRPAVSLRAP
jgi:FtsX-like permease family